MLKYVLNLGENRFRGISVNKDVELAEPKIVSIDHSTFPKVLLGAGL